ncbi:MAG TPA: hypothetical protein VNT76_01195 [Candidatus Binatus sp.]|nr:hypothetical protein [Candidatus Binatus sp.]
MATDNPYNRRFNVPKWTRQVTVCDVPALFHRLPEFDGWTKAQHIAVSLEYLELARVTDQMHLATIGRMVAAFGDGNGILISGVYRDHFPETVKTDLRTLAHTASDYLARSASHWRFAGKRLQTWRHKLECCCLTRPEGLNQE